MQPQHRLSTTVTKTGTIKFTREQVIVEVACDCGFFAEEEVQDYEHTIEKCKKELLLRHQDGERPPMVGEHYYTADGLDGLAFWRVVRVRKAAAITAAGHEIYEFESEKLVRGLEDGVLSWQIADRRWRHDVVPRYTFETARDRVRELRAAVVTDLEAQLLSARERLQEVDTIVDPATLLEAEHDPTSCTSCLIFGMGELFEVQASGEKRPPMFGTLQRSAQSLMHAIGDVVDLSKIEAGRLTLEAVEFSVQEILRSVVDLLKSASLDQGIRLSLKSSHESLTDHVRSDPARLRQILFNLVSSAVKLTRAQSVDVVANRTSGPDGAVRWQFEIRDVGVQDAGPRRHSFDNGDLGFSIAKHLVEAMGGELTTGDATGDRIAYTFALDFAPATPHVVDAAVDPYRTRATPLRILVAEDHPVNQMLVRAMLQRMGHSVTCVADGREAVDASATGAFDVVLMDMHMPVMDGPTATRRIRELGTTYGKIPIVALTADGLPEHRLLFESAGLSDFVMKPIDPVRLGAILDTLSDKKQSSAATLPAA